MINPYEKRPGLGAWLQRFWLKNLLRAFPYSYTSPRGYRIACRRRYEILMCHGALHEALAAARRELGEVKTVVDLGANIGVFSILAADAFYPGLRRIVAVEPFAENAARIMDTVRRNGLSEIVQVLPRAVGKESAAGMLQLGSAHYSHSMRVEKFAAPVGTQPVEVVSLDELAGECGLEEIDVLKMDVEGAELDVIAGGQRTLARTRWLFIEAHKPFSTLGYLKRALAPLGLFPHASMTKSDTDDGDFWFVRR